MSETAALQDQSYILVTGANRYILCSMFRILSNVSVAYALQWPRVFHLLPSRGRIPELDSPEND